MFSITVLLTYMLEPWLLSDIKSMTLMVLKFLIEGSTLLNCNIRDGADF